MPGYEVDQPILNSPYDEPKEHWRIEKGEEPQRLQCRREAGYFYRDPRAPLEGDETEIGGSWIPLDTVNLIRTRLTEWREQGYPSVSRTTHELLHYWRRNGREHRLFFAQLEAAETIIFLTEARADLLQGIFIPLDEPSEDQKAEGYAAFKRYACKMATGTGKTTVMGMLAAWSILNKVNDRSDGRFSDVVLVVCPNITIRTRLQELDPALGEASIYRKRDLVPPHLIVDLTKGRVLVTNWHVFEPQGVRTGGVGSKVIKAGIPVRGTEVIHIGTKTTTARGYKYLTTEALDRRIAAGLIEVKSEDKDAQGNLRRVFAESVRYVESDTSLVNRVLGREVGGKQNILIFNDEAHHAYRIRRPEPDEGEEDLLGGKEEIEEFLKEATVWVDGLDRIHKLRGINCCVDMSATPYFLGRVGHDTNRVYPWVVSDFGLTDAIESGLVKIPQLAVRDTSGDEIPGYFNIWRWILKYLTPAERGGKKASPKPEAILKYACTPIAMLGGLWDEMRRAWEKDRKADPRPPVFILVCKNTKLAKVVHEWLTGGATHSGIHPARIDGFHSEDGVQRTIRVDTKVVHETDMEGAKSDEMTWMRLTLDTVGKVDWPTDGMGRPIYPEGFEDLAEKLSRPLHPPGRDVRCIVSVGMLTEGWDCSTVTHIIGLRPFMSQLLCEQVVGRGLRRSNYEVGPDGLMTEEIAKIFGVPFEVIPFKQSGRGPIETPKRHHVHAIPTKVRYEIKFPRVEGYLQAIRNRVLVKWDSVATLDLDPQRIPPEVQVKAFLPSNQKRPSLMGPGKIENVNLNPYRAGRRLQQLVFEMASDLTRDYCAQSSCQAPAHVLFPQLARIVEKYLRDKVYPAPPAQILDVFLSPYYGWVIERLVEATMPDVSQGEAPEIPRYETSRGPGSTSDVNFWTSRDVRDVQKSHVNYVVADTRHLEQSAAYVLDTHPAVKAFVKNAGLGFAIPYFHNGQPHDYEPDFIIRIEKPESLFLILETKGFDPLEEVKTQAAIRWVNAVNADGSYGKWNYVVVKNTEHIRNFLENI